MVIKKASLDVAEKDFGVIFRNGSGIKCGPTALLIKGLCLTIFGILLYIWTPYELIMNERLRMHKGLPAFEWWKVPPELVYMRVRMFNYTNIDRFLAGLDDILNVNEIGPLIYKEILYHHNITRNDNSTISFNANHTAQFEPELNTLRLDDKIVVPNYALLSMVTYLHNAPFFAKLAFNMLVRTKRTEIYKVMTLQDFLWNFTDPILDVTNNLVPFIVPVRNIGMLHRIYEDFEDQVTMYMGIEHGDDLFSLINKFKGSSYLPNYKNCDDVVTNATEGVTYPQRLTRKSVLRYWRKTICKVVQLKYQEDCVHSGVSAYRYTLPPDTYNRTLPTYKDCYKGIPNLPDGLSDVSNCMYDVPIAVSFPHFLYGDDKIKNYVTGLTPDYEKHKSFVVAEPNTGIPLESIARSQSNLIVRKLHGFNKNVTKFSDMALPMFWLEYHQIGIPFKVLLLVYFTAVICKPMELILISSLIIFGFWYVVRFGKLVTESERYKKTFRKQEQEIFLK